MLKFGSFTLKSGRISPYFFNAGLFSSGKALAQLGEFYADAVQDAITSKGVQFDVLFGPAYKGIPLASATAVALWTQHKVDVPYAFNRKEAKDHGEGGNIVGAALKGKRVLIVDDVITAGTAIRESIALIKAAGGEPVGVVIALDRQEKGTGELSAVQEINKDYGLPVIYIVGLAEVIKHLEATAAPETVQAIKAYRDQYGV